LEEIQEKTRWKEGILRREWISLESQKSAKQ
jgi:hypothetical protein